MSKKYATNLVKLETPLTRGETKITEIEVIRPNIKSLKGLQLLDVMQIKVDSFITLLPRITLPSLTKNEVENLDPIDFTKLCTEVIGFFGKTEETEQ